MSNDSSPQPGAGSAPADNARASDDPGVRAQFNDLRQSVAEDVDAVRHAVAQGGVKAGAKLNDAVADQAHFAAHQVAGVAQALQKVGDELQGTDQAHVGRYVSQIGGGVRDFASRMEGKDTGELARLAEDFGRRQPLAFLGMAALAGLMASRFLTASAKHGATAKPTGQSGTGSGTGGEFNG